MNQKKEELELQEKIDRQIGNKLVAWVRNIFYKKPVIK